jgi:hypothetical protein
VIALQAGAAVTVAEIDDGWLGRPYDVHAGQLTGLPMRYFHGQVPR